MTDRIAEEDLAEYIGKRVLDDADKLRLFMPNFQARFPLDYAGRRFWVRVHLDELDSDP